MPPTGFRWRLAGDDGGQPSLFSDEELLDRHVGRGEFRGLEFLHVNARTIINKIPAAARLPFGYTINAYRGCSHACSYSESGAHRVLMADGRTKPLRDVRPGDSVVGSTETGGRRDLVATAVLDRWTLRRRACRIVLDDGGWLDCGSEHRYLSDRGWAHAMACREKGCPHPVLRAGDRIAAVGSTRALTVPPTPFSAHFVVVAADRCAENQVGIGRGPSWRRVVRVEPLGAPVELVDLTTGTGDYVSEGVISHNCFARPTHEYLGLGIGRDFDSKIVVKINAVERVRAEVSSKRWTGEPIAMGTNTDPYQRCEGKYHLTRGIVNVLGQARNPFSILTKSTLILRDLDVLTEAAARTDVRTSFSIGTLDEEVWKRTEPGAPHPRQRVEAVAKLNAAGIPCGVLVAPVIPGMSDDPAQLRAVVEACRDAGAVSISAIPLHLRTGVKDHFMAWLAGARPDLVASYERRYSGRAHLPAAERDLISGIVRRAASR